SDNGKQQIASLSNDGKKAAFMRDNNLFIKDLDTKKEIQITQDGAKNKIINGAPDWVYEEEFGYNKAYSWSPDGKYLAYVKFDESKINEFSIIEYAGAAPNKQEYLLYPGLYTYKYPKAGEDNSIVSVHIYNLSTGKTIKADIGTETDIYIPRIKWNFDGSSLAIERLNRFQNKIELLYANPNTGESKIIITEKNKYFIDDDYYDNILFLEDNEHILLLSERDGYKHLYLYKTDGTFVRQITKGDWDVTKFYGFDQNKGLFYYQSAEESSINRDVYSIKISGKRKRKLSTLEGTNKAQFNNNYEYYINIFSNATTPTFVTLNDSKGKVIRILEENAKVKEIIKEYGGANKTFFTFKTSEGVELNAFKIVPPDFDATKKYPVLVVQYSGPNSQTVVNSWDFSWNNYLAQQGIIIVGVDPRGTGGKGEEFRKMTFHELGKYETIDLIETAKYLGNFSYINKDKIGIWGWSYGGFMVLNTMTKGNGIFSTGISVAPVSNWRYYDNIYTERYMGKPQNNADGYDKNSPLNYTDGFQGNLLLCFGTADDNVHPQNSFEFIEKMVQSDKQFTVFPFVNRNHGIYGGNTRMYLYKMKTDFLIKHLLDK
ncbi:MAG: S9 family peptidase, partial [Bacteroidota bacterium]|nr:S9 family peptidase [Bacteroidota bacterium]